jgi:hypothetical protein
MQRQVNLSHFYCILFQENCTEGLYRTISTIVLARRQPDDDDRINVTQLLDVASYVNLSRPKPIGRVYSHRT